MTNLQPSLDLDEIRNLDKVWKTQGRTEEQKWAVTNFLTGAGATAINDLINSRVQAAVEAELKYILSHSSGGGSWRRVIAIRLANLKS